jgi:hypothetical protein
MLGLALLGCGVRILKGVALYQKGQSGSSCSTSFWNSSSDHFVALPTRQQFKQGNAKVILNFARSYVATKSERLLTIT